MLVIYCDVGLSYDHISNQFASNPCILTSVGLTQAEMMQNFFITHVQYRYCSLQIFFIVQKFLWTLKPTKIYYMKSFNINIKRTRCTDVQQTYYLHM